MAMPSRDWFDYDSTPDGSPKSRDQWKGLKWAVCTGAAAQASITCQDDDGNNIGAKSLILYAESLDVAGQPTDITNGIYVHSAGNIRHQSVNTTGKVVRVNYIDKA
jgi:hypothetical protein